MRLIGRGNITMRLIGRGNITRGHSRRKETYTVGLLPDMRVAIPNNAFKVANLATKFRKAIIELFK